ncbi:hypothetical protein EZS27_014382 [termite gut metagenome]|uniref:Uncharacterized protein n=1 Tax=termite gut metagenome TaxID=433724 RepID=A0A5J4RV20_9ZZZZ
MMDCSFGKITENNVANPKTALMKKKYNGENDFITKTEQQLITQCKAKGIVTTKGNGEAYNNVEKREKLRAYRF